jgi:UDP-N-acetylglucosamine--N-acetylmuramyl-(pentapeptide) pyrophosphoryl-undecaprenol N-acetylglucosamine transferase
VGPGIAALLSGRPLLLLEQNAVSGRANRLLSRLGGFLAATWPESLLDLPRYARTRARVVGNPVRAELRGGRRDPAAFGLDPDRPVLLVTGGSQGARGLNDRVCAAAPLFARHRVGVIHLCGAGEEARVGRAWRDAGATACVRAFTREMGDVYASADLVLARAGGTTVAELAFLGKPSVLVPYPHHADRHQERNARVLEAVGAARVVPESELTPERAEREILGALLDGGELGRMGAAAARLGVPDAAERAASFAREVLWRAARGPGRSRAREKGREAVVDDLG